MICFQIEKNKTCESDLWPHLHLVDLGLDEGSGLYMRLLIEQNLTHCTVWLWCHGHNNAGEVLSSWRQRQRGTKSWDLKLEKGREDVLTSRTKRWWWHSYRGPCRRSQKEDSMNHLNKYKLIPNNINRVEEKHKIALLNCIVYCIIFLD